ncbi:MAG: phosphoesterase [Candidatus Hepatoplasma scabrum]|nr:MAG: phosphoesterase [Candidatus Hepatoplasma sp.]
MEKFSNDFLKKIEDYQKIIIHRHKNPDGDALGSQYGLFIFLKINFPNKKIMLAHEDDLNWLPIFFKKEDNPEQDDFKNALIIICDTANKERIANSNYQLGREIIKIDHHPQIDNYGAKLKYVNYNRSSCSEIIFDLINYLKTNNNLKINSKIANYLFLGILTDTGRFSYPSVNSDTFRVLQAIYQIEGFKADKIYKLLNTITEKDLKYQAYVINHYKQEDDFAYFVGKKNLAKKFKLDFEKITHFVSVLMLNNNTNIALYAIYNYKDKLFSVSLRSRKIAVNKIAQKYGGGGHKLAAGVKIKDKKKLLSLIKEIKDLNRNLLE